MCIPTQGLLTGQMGLEEKKCRVLLTMLLLLINRYG